MCALQFAGLTIFRKPIKYFYNEIFFNEVLTGKEEDMPSNPSTASDALHKFLLIHRHLRQTARNADEHGIRGRQVAVLQFIQEHGPATVTEIKEHLYTSVSTASTLIKDLEDAGYVVRTRSQEDNRVVIVELTASGSALAETNAIAGIGLLRRRLPTLPEERLQMMNEALADIILLMEVPDSE